MNTFVTASLYALLSGLFLTGPIINQANAAACSESIKKAIKSSTVFKNMLEEAREYRKVAAAITPKDWAKSQQQKHKFQFPVSFDCIEGNRQVQQTKKINGLVYPVKTENHFHVFVKIFATSGVAPKTAMKLFNIVERVNSKSNLAQFSNNFAITSVNDFGNNFKF